MQAEAALVLAEQAQASAEEGRKGEQVLQASPELLYELSGFGLILFRWRGRERLSLAPSR